MRRGAGQRRRGFTLLELAIATALLVIVGVSLAGALAGLQGAARTGDVLSKLQEAGERATAAIVADLRRSGMLALGGLDYPYVFEGGVPDPAFAAHAHAPARKRGEPGDADFGPDREIVFVLPRDADGDGIPDLDAAGELLWDPAEFSYVLVTHPDGVNRLERRADAALQRVVASHVERIVFDDVDTDPLLPLDAVRVRVFLRQEDPRGEVYRYRSEVVVHLRNG